MTDILQLEPRHRWILNSLLQKHLPGVEVWAYGSRVSGRGHDGSDLDIALRGNKLEKIPEDRLARFADAVRDSNIPFLVETRDWARMPEWLQQDIEREHAVLRPGR